MKWVKTSAPKVLTGGVKIGAAVGQTILTKLLLKYYGLKNPHMGDVPEKELAWDRLARSKGFVAAKLAEICSVDLHSFYTGKHDHIIRN
jgi:hypothetical protein